MANTAQARKRARQAVGRRARNVSLRSRARTAIKRVSQALEQREKTEAQQAFAQAVKVMDQVADKGALHKNTVARYKSRLNARIRALD